MLRFLTINKKLFKQLDFGLIIVSILIVVIGALNIYSARQSNNDGLSFVCLQILWLAICLFTIYIILIFDYAVFMKYASIIYWLGILLLVFNDLTSKAVNGAAMWIKIGNRAIEPGEFARLCLILILAKKLQEMDNNINNLKNFTILALYGILPMALIFLQPDLGLTTVCFFVILGIFYMSGLKVKTILLGFAAIGLILMIVWNSGVIKVYQKDRLTSFLNPVADSAGSGYQLSNSKKSIGSGGILGQGYQNGVMVKGGFVPENHTDFIFSVLGEEWGFVGEVVLLFLYGIMIVKVIIIGKNSKDIFGSVICTGVVSSLLFSIFQNIGMTIGLTPISGITLPFMSYGGSSMLTNYISLGLVLNVGIRKKKINF